MNQRGFTLVEVLVATLLFALLGTGGFAAWARGNAAWHEASIEQGLHERAQYVFATLEPELQMAGYFGDSLRPPPLTSESIPAGAQDCGLALLQRLDQPIEVSATYTLPCAARNDGAMPSSQQLTIRRASAQLATATAGRAQWLDNEGVGRVTWNDPDTGAAGAQRRDLLVRVYYVARASDGDAATPALRMKSLGSIAGEPAFIDTEVMPGVETLQAELLPDAEAPRSLRLTLTLRADQAELWRGQIRHITVTREFALRDAAAG